MYLCRDIIAKIITIHGAPYGQLMFVSRDFCAAMMSLYEYIILSKLGRYPTILECVRYDCGALFNCIDLKNAKIENYDASEFCLNYDDPKTCYPACLCGGRSYLPKPANFNHLNILNAVLDISEDRDIRGIIWSAFLDSMPYASLISNIDIPLCLYKFVDIHTVFSYMKTPKKYAIASIYAMLIGRRDMVDVDKARQELLLHPYSVTALLICIDRYTYRLNNNVSTKKIISIMRTLGFFEEYAVFNDINLCLFLRSKVVFRAIFTVLRQHKMNGHIYTHGLAVQINSRCELYKIKNAHRLMQFLSSTVRNFEITKVHLYKSTIIGYIKTKEEYISYTNLLVGWGTEDIIKDISAARDLGISNDVINEYENTLPK